MYNLFVKLEGSCLPLAEVHSKGRPNLQSRGHVVVALWYVE